MWVSGPLGVQRQPQATVRSEAEPALRPSPCQPRQTRRPGMQRRLTAIQVAGLCQSQRRNSRKPLVPTMWNSRFCGGLGFSQQKWVKIQLTYPSPPFASEPGQKPEHKAESGSIPAESGERWEPGKVAGHLRGCSGVKGKGGVGGVACVRLFWTRCGNEILIPELSPKWWG